MSAPLNAQLLRLSQLLQLEDRARTVQLTELFFLIVNETSSVVSYRQSALWRRQDDGGSIVAVSGAAALETGGPYAEWLRNTVKSIAQSGSGEIKPVGPADVSAELGSEWMEWFPPYGLWCPLTLADGTELGGLLLGRSDPWTDADQQILANLAGCYAQCLGLLTLQGNRNKTRLKFRPRPALIAAAIVLAILAFFPFRISVLAPAEVIASSPAPIRAPFEGVVEAVNVTPNAPVHAGDTLFSLDTTELRARNEVASKALDMARAEFSETSQQAMADPRAKAKLAQLESKEQQQQAEAAYDGELLKRAVVTSPIDGVAVFDDPTSWIGKPVVLGERVMLVASPTDLALEIQVPVGSVVTFKPGAEIEFFGNIAPDQPVEAKLVYASYASSMTPEGVMAYPFRARLGTMDGMRLGLKGTAKIYGPRQPLVLWVLRRPIAVLRQWLAL